MHTEQCEGDFRDWWPQSEPLDIAMSTLPAAGAVTNPIRLVGGSDAPWVGVWGPFVGLRIAYSPRVSYPISSGAAFVYPRGDNDLYLSSDTGFAGKLSMAKFRTREAALAWGQSNNEILRVTGGSLGPFPAATAMVSNDPNPTTTRVGANLLLWDKTKLSWARAQNVANSGGPNAGGRLTVEDGWLDQSQIIVNVSTASTGVKSSYTCPSGRVARCTWQSYFNRSGTAAVVAELQITRGSTLSVLRFTTAASVGQNNGTFASYDLAATDVIQWNVLTAQAASTADFGLWIEERDVETP